MASLDSDEERGRIGLPPLLFLFTLEQICSMIQVDMTSLMRNHLWYTGVTPGMPMRRQMRAVNVGEHKEPIWRVSQRDFVSWAKRQGFKVSDYANYS
jgi:hypothetical protein